MRSVRLSGPHVRPANHAWSPATRPDAWTANKFLVMHRRFAFPLPGIVAIVGDAGVRPAASTRQYEQARIPVEEYPLYVDRVGHVVHGEYSATQQ